MSQCKNLNSRLKKYLTQTKGCFGLLLLLGLIFDKFWNPNNSRLWDIYFYYCKVHPTKNFIKYQICVIIIYRSIPNFITIRHFFAELWAKPLKFRFNHISVKLQPILMKFTMKAQMTIAQNWYFMKKFVGPFLQ